MNETHCLTIRKTYKEKLRPTPTQEREQEREYTLLLCRRLYNTALEQRITAWQRCRISVSRFQQEAELKELRAEFPRSTATCCKTCWRGWTGPITRSSGGCSAARGERRQGSPRFKGRNRYHSLTFKEYGNGTRLDNGHLVLAKIGRIRVHWSRPIEGTPKPVTLSREADGWYAGISCTEVPARPLPRTGRETSIDLGLEAFATLADGTRIRTPGYCRRAERSLATCQRWVAKPKKGRHRRCKAVCWLAKAHQTVRRQRQDLHHQTALALVRTDDMIYHEDVQVRPMARNPQRAKRLADAGSAVVALDPTFTSQACSGCGAIVHPGVSVRWPHCRQWGTSLHGDHHAAKHRARRWQRLGGTRRGCRRGRTEHPPGC
ncbi:MAG TPA: transposase [Ktedonobacterales bacterium]|nr:transposase [Ktedonobacterales bacterium]